MSTHDIYPFTDRTQQALFYKIIGQLRCTVCSNQNLSDSAAPLAIELKDRIYQEILLGGNEKEVLAFATSRYGDFISYAPPVRSDTLALWGGPILGVLLVIIAIVRTVRFQSSPK